MNYGRSLMKYIWLYTTQTYFKHFKKFTILFVQKFLGYLGTINLVITKNTKNKKDILELNRNLVFKYTIFFQP